MALFIIATNITTTAIIVLVLAFTIYHAVKEKGNPEKEAD